MNAVLFYKRMKIYGLHCQTEKKNTSKKEKKEHYHLQEVRTEVAEIHKQVLACSSTTFNSSLSLKNIL